MKIVLLGYMGSGKTTIGKELANQLNLSFIDLDDYIEKKENNSITSIFKEKGEVYFRLKEHQYLKELIQNNDTDFILSLGGGTPCYANNIDVIIQEKNTQSIYLQMSVSELSERLEKEKENRPLITNLWKDKLSEFIAKHLFERAFYYNKANHKIEVQQKTVLNIVEEIQQLLR